MLVDAHAHLDMPQFDADRAQVLARAEAAGLVIVVTAGTNLDSSRQAIAIAESSPIVAAAVGIHPNEMEGWSEKALADLRALARHPKVVAIGEIGLDFHWKRTPVPLQLESFRRQLALASELGLPVVIHDREAHAEVRREVAAWARSSPVAGMVHAFSGDVSMALELAGLGLFVSVAGPVTYPRADRLREVCRQMPREWLLVETDSPYLAPQPMRGKRNEPAYVHAVAREVARARGEDEAVLSQALVANALSLFRKFKPG